MSAAYAFFVSVFVYKDLTLKQVPKVLLDSANLSAMILYIITNAVLFSFLLTSEQIPQSLAAWINDMGLSPWMFLMVVNILLLIAGNFMEPSSILLITAPILFPVAMKLGIDPIHLGIMMTVNMEIGMITPPVGLNLYVASGIANMGLTEVTKACAPWILVMLAFLMLITYVPAISLWLPNLLMGCGELSAARHAGGERPGGRPAAGRALSFRAGRRRYPAARAAARRRDGRTAAACRRGAVKSARDGQAAKCYNFEFSGIYRSGDAQMAVERTLSIIKPDAVAKNVIGKIYSRFETNGLKIVAAQMRWLSRAGSRGLLRGAPRAPVLQGSGRVHDLRPGDDPGARGRERDRQEPRPDGRDRPEEGRRGHHPRRFRREHRRQRGAWLRRPGHGGGRDRLFLPGARGLLALSAAPAPARPIAVTTCSTSTPTVSTAFFADAARSRSARGRCCAGCTSASATTSTR